MQPSNMQLLKQLRGAAEQLLQTTGAQQENRVLIEAMGVVIDELLVRGDRRFFVDHYLSARALIARGLACAGPKAAPLKEAVSTLPTTLDPEVAFDVIAENSSEAADILSQLIELIGGDTDKVSEDFQLQASLWERQLYAHRENRVTLRPSKNKSLTFDAPRVQAYLRSKRPEWSGLTVTDFHPVAIGFSKCTILVDTVDAANEKRSFAIRAEQPIHIFDMEGAKAGNEFAIVKEVYARGIPAAEPLWVEDDVGLFNGRFIVSRRVAGRNFGDSRGGDKLLSASAVRSLANTLARIHQIPIDPQAEWVRNSHFKDFAHIKSVRENALARIAMWREQAQIAGIFPTPAAARVLNWLKENVPDCDDAPALLHGDFGPHNILLDGEQVAAVLDWELAIPGDAAQDVSWFLAATGGTADPEEFLRAYAEAGGRQIDEYRLRYYEVFMYMEIPMCCRAAVKLVEEHDDAKIHFSLYALQHMSTFVGRAEEAIERAMAAKLRTAKSDALRGI